MTYDVRFTLSGLMLQFERLDQTNRTHMFFAEFNPKPGFTYPCRSLTASSKQQAKRKSEFVQPRVEMMGIALASALALPHDLWLMGVAIRPFDIEQEYRLQDAPHWPVSNQQRLRRHGKGVPACG